MHKSYCSLVKHLVRGSKQHDVAVVRMKASVVFMQHEMCMEKAEILAEIRTHEQYFNAAYRLQTVM